MPLAELQIMKKGVQNTTSKNLRKIEKGCLFQDSFEKQNRAASCGQPQGSRSINSPLAALFIIIIMFNAMLLCTNIQQKCCEYVIKSLKNQKNLMQQKHAAMKKLIQLFRMKL